MACRVIAYFTLNEGEIGKIIEFGEGANGFQVSKNFKWCLGIDMSIDMDNPNRMILTETWEDRDDHTQYMKFREKYRGIKTSQGNIFTAPIASGGGLTDLILRCLVFQISPFGRDDKS